MRAKAKDLTNVRMDRIERQVIGQQVVAQILELIRIGSLHAGDRLPPERELIEIFGISRPSLREALRALSTLGVVKALHGGGAYVSDLEVRTLLAPLDFYPSLSKANFVDAFDSRRVIEIEIVQSTLGLDFQNFDERARNEPGLIAQSTADHAEIAGAIGAHDADRAGRAMARHIRNIELSTQRIISGRGGEALLLGTAKRGRTAQRNAGSRKPRPTRLRSSA
jgi:DNA-binding FadR family transcriptional regulator